MIEPDVFKAIVGDISDGLSMRDACQNAGVNRRAFYEALDSDPAWANQYARAKEAQLEAMADDITAIADAREGEVIVAEDGRRLIDNEAVQRARLRVDTRKWLLSKLAPKKYGDRVTNEHTGPEDGPIAFRLLFGK